MPKFFSLLSLLFISIVSYSQQISGIINTYTPLVTYDVCENKLTVEDASTFNIGDTVLLIQMKGAVIDSSNTSNFGTITNYKNAGNYEFNYVKQKAGNIIFLKNNLSRSYDLPAGKVQLIRVPYYNSVTVTSTLTCLPWDGSKGGVLALNVRDTLYLNNKIDISGKGFWGGKSVNPKSNTAVCNQTLYYSSDPIYAAPKGEGIAVISSSKSLGRGPLSNGGGGGVGHNSGGAGGSNGSSGGKGGKEWVSCNTALDNGGISGKFLSYSNIQNRIFMGGGGGAGHCDNIPGFNAEGGNGGGVLIVQANFLKANNNSIIAGGASAAECTPDGAQPYKCHEGMGGGGAGGTVLLKVNSFLDNIVTNINGGKGADMKDNGNVGRLGPGGGGSGGLLWLSGNTLPANVSVINTGGSNGVNINYGNDSYGAAPGQNGLNFFNLVIPTDTVLFKKNIDSVRIKDSAIACNSFDFKGLVYTNTNLVSSWQWNFGDGSTAGTQNTSHAYANPGTYSVKLIVTDANGCKDSVTKNVIVKPVIDFDFTYQQNICDPFTIQFFNVGINSSNPYWSFGDGATSTNELNPVHTYSSFGNYIVKYIVQNDGCTDTVAKTISVNTILEDIITTPDTIICAGNTLQLKSVPSLNFCWSPVIYLDNANSPNPVTSTPENITYYLNAEVTGVNLIDNGDFNSGNTGFTSEYQYISQNTTEGEYFVGANPRSWNGALSACGDHTNGSGNMMLINGAPVADVNVWKQTITVTPNTNYAFSTWIQALYPPNPAQLQFSINGRSLGNIITASLPPCTWSQFYTTWNSGNLTSATISIVNKNTEIQGNDFALDDISFAPVFIKRDSVVITVDKPVIKTNNDTTVCPGIEIQINTSGASAYTWTPTTGLSDPEIADPIATINDSVTFIVTGTTINGCSAKDTLTISTFAKPLINLINDTAICKNSGIQLMTGGSDSYSWTPASTLNNPNISNPIATPDSTTKYYVTAVNASGCSNTDSVEIIVNSLPVITRSNDTTICANSSVQLSASGGSTYSWTPAISLSNSDIANPVATPIDTTTYHVTVADVNGCFKTDSVRIFTMPLPAITISNDTAICANSSVQLSSSGGSTYLWTPASSLNNSDIANPIATPIDTTTYHVTVTGANTCFKTDSVKIFIISLPVITISNDTAICLNSSVQLSSSGGSTYSWTPISTLSNPGIANPVAMPLDTTTYHLTVMDINGCSQTDSVKIFTIPLPVITISNDTAICLNNSVQLSASGGSGYSWTPISSLSNPNIANPIAIPNDTTTYHVTVMDTNGCSKTDSVSIYTKLLPAITISNDTAVCDNTPVQLNATGGMTYSWTPAATLSNSSINNPIATTSTTTNYILTVTNSEGCINTDSVKVITSPLPVISISNDTSICANTSLQLFASGGSAYLWSPSFTLSNANISTPEASPVTNTIYTVTVSNNSGCFTKDSVQISVYPNAVITVSNDTLVCNNTNTQLFASGGSTYIWSPGITLNNANIPDPVALPSATTKYFVDITDVNSCKYKDSVIISVILPPVFTISANDSVCFNNTTQLFASGGDTYLWQPAGSLSAQNISNPIAAPDTTTLYTVKIKSNTCNDSAILTTAITVVPLPNVSVTKSNDIDCSNNFSQLNAAGATQFLWTPSVSLNNNRIANPIATPTSNTLYQVKGIDNNGCENTDTITVMVGFNNSSLYLMPNSFTPNADGLNDCFGPKYWGRIEELDFNIYNRFGERIFHTQNPSACWDGTYKGMPQDSNVFVYTIVAKTVCGTVNKKGTFVLLK